MSIKKMKKRQSIRTNNLLDSHPKHDFPPLIDSWHDMQNVRGDAWRSMTWPEVCWWVWGASHQPWLTLWERSSPPSKAGKAELNSDSSRKPVTCKVETVHPFSDRTNCKYTHKSAHSGWACFAALQCHLGVTKKAKGNTVGEFDIKTERRWLVDCSNKFTSSDTLT